MESLKKQNRIEWVFLAAMIVLCAILTVMQYRWTGEVARAEMERLRPNIELPAQQLCRAFDAELIDACAQLLPAAAVVSASRHRNFAIAALLNALMLGAGVLLVRHTRWTRRLADKQMNFVASVSHELRTPLTVIRGAAHNLQRGVVQEPGRIAHYSGLITQQAGQLTDMVEEILALAGAQRSSAMQRQPLSLVDVVNDAGGVTKACAPLSGVESSWERADGILPGNSAKVSERTDFSVESPLITDPGGVNARLPWAVVFDTGLRWGRLDAFLSLSDSGRSVCTPANP